MLTPREKILAENSRKFTALGKRHSSQVGPTPSATASKKRKSFGSPESKKGKRAGDNPSRDADSSGAYNKEECAACVATSSHFSPTKNKPLEEVFQSQLQILIADLNKAASHRSSLTELSPRFVKCCHNSCLGMVVEPVMACLARLGPSSRLPA